MEIGLAKILKRKGLNFASISFLYLSAAQLSASFTVKNH